MLTLTDHLFSSVFGSKFMHSALRTLIVTPTYWSEMDEISSRKLFLELSAR